MWTETLIAVCRREGIPFSEMEPMKAHTTFKIGGPARVMAMPGTVGQIAALMQGGFPLVFVGRGSNLLVADAGIDGAVVLLGNNFSGVTAEGEVLVCEAGASLSKACRTALEHGLSGLEFAYGIPGTVGGAVYMNAGAYGGEMKDVVLWAEHLDRAGRLHRLSGEELSFSYRHSRYSGGEDCIVRAAFGLRPGDPGQIGADMEALMAKRREKQPLEYPSAGSTFKRPAGGYAAELIERCGLKGFRVGDAMVSEKHSGFVVNCGEATAAEVEELMAAVAERVLAQTGIQLEPEVRRLGSWQR
ncbi:MAG: UDP-N-acetylmuramate dehydrogenase [Oscillospiraceae bacterium]|jgi:UDP-N-acetylmuramate dehydrogenase|nr:UDP-N-acetylmuramate dehydrogenase [Oscillospiraceae bacterium]